jgi:hypothetical protein
MHVPSSHNPTILLTNPHLVLLYHSTTFFNLSKTNQMHAATTRHASLRLGQAGTAQIAPDMAIYLFLTASDMRVLSGRQS